MVLQIPQRGTSSHTALWSTRDNNKADRQRTLASRLGGDTCSALRPDPRGWAWSGVSTALYAHLLHVLASTRSWAQCRGKKGLGKNELESYRHLAPGRGCADKGCRSDTTAREGHQISDGEGHWQPGWLGFWEGQVPGLRAEGCGWERLWTPAVETCWSPDSITKSH